MKISLNWLNEYVDVKEFFSKPQELAELLTRAGLEVEDMEDYSTRFQSLWIGEILELSQHPQADRLTVCQVQTGKGQTHQIVCGAKNHKSGDKVVVALPGAVLPGDFAIKKSKIRGIESDGMLCSKKELGLADVSEGIFILPAEAPVGEGFARFSGLDDVVFELKVTPNRADCLSHFGLAREVACLLGREFSLPLASLLEQGASTAAVVNLEVMEKELCPRYCGRLIQGVTVSSSPTWLRKRLETVGLKSINNVVDVTNFVMLELGQPLHAFDVKEIRGGSLSVGLAQSAEKFTTLDGTEIILSGEELVIRDAQRPVALAGVVGGLNSGITETTTDIFVESAYFRPQVVRKTARKFGIETDSAYRFSRGVDPEGIMLALNRACQLIQDVAGGQIGSHAYDEYPHPLQRPSIEISLETLEADLGYSVSSPEFTGWMERLGCRVNKLGGENKGEAFVIVPPTYRVDLSMDVDLVEEYARLNGYEHIPETLPAFGFAPKAHDQEFVTTQRVHQLAQAQGFQQAVNYAFVSSQWQSEFLGDRELMSKLGLDLAPEAIRILNPLNESLDVMRLSLLPALFQNMLHSYRYGSECGRVYESGSTFFRASDAYGESSRLSLIGWGHQTSPWKGNDVVPLVYELKGAVEQMLEGLNISSWRWQMLKAQEVPGFAHPEQCAVIFFEGKPAGFVGSLHPSVKEKYKLRHQCALGELDMNKILRGQPKKPIVSSIAKFPAVERDLAFLLPESVVAGDVAQEIRKAAGEVLKEISIFDVFSGEGLGDGMRSVGFRMKYQDLRGTLEEAQILGLQDKVIDSVCRKFSIRVR